MEGRDVESIQGFREMIASIDPGSRVGLLILRDGSEIRKNVILDQQPESYVASADDEPSPEIGWHLSTLTREIAGRLGDESLRGVLVESVEPGGTADRAGLVRGDVLLEVNRTGVSSSTDVEELVAGSSGDVLLLVWRQGTTIFVVINR